jgi:beta-glucanase (GH16 family)
MKKNHTLIILLITVQMFAQLPAGNWNLVWEDNFDGNYLNSKKWKMGLHWLGIGGGHYFANSGKSVIVKDGFLTLRAEKRPEIFAGIQKPYASAEISTFKRFKQKYGYFEARIKYNAVKGSWPAFWMMPNRGIKQQGPFHADARSYIKFDISSLNTPITSAKFKVMVMPQTEIDKNYSVSIHKIINNDTWTENNITWKNKPVCDAAFLKQFMGSVDGNLINQINVGEHIEIDVTDYINSQISKNKQFAGFALMSQFMNNQRVEFGSKENPEINNRPVLEVDGIKIYPSDDAMVRITDPNTGFGSGERLHVCDKWAKDVGKTDNGGMEMDIMESLGVWGENKTQHALHWDNYGANHKYQGSGQLNIPSTSDGFHTYGMEWAEGELKFYIDGVLTWTYTNPRVSTVDSYLILSHALGGWNGSGNVPIADAQLPVDMLVDYVRVYKKTPYINEENQILTIFPNPIENEILSFKINDPVISDPIEMAIYNVLGEMIYKTSIDITSIDSIIKIPLDNLNLKRGTYFLSVKGREFISTQKFLYE